MKNSLRILSCFFMAVILIISPFSGFLSKTDAASVKRYFLSDVSPSQFTNNQSLLANLEKIFEEYPTAFTTTGTVCSKSHSGTNYCKTFKSHQSHEHSGTGTQCFGYANYVYETLFGTYWDAYEYIYDDGTLGSTTSAAKIKSEFERTGACFGTIIRSKEPHSMIVLSTDADGVWLLHANYGGSTYGGCNTAIHYYPWSNFASSHGQLKYIIVPHSICEECVYTAESYPLCTECGHKFNGFKSVYATYSAKDSIVSYSLPLDGCENLSTIENGTVITVVSEFTINGEEWLCSEEGDYYKKSNLTFTGYKSSLKTSSLVCPEHIVKGKSFWLGGTVTSKNTIKSLTVSILNTDGSMVESNTIYPNANTAEVKDADNLAFRKLTTGEYIYELSAVDDAETKVLYSGHFSVISSTTIATAFPDTYFRKYIIENILDGTPASDTDYVDKYSDIFASVTELNVSDLGIQSLTGIERFVSIETIDCSGNKLTSIDLSELSHLADITVSDQKFATDAVYDSEYDTFTASLEDVFLKTYSRPMSLPATEYVLVETGINGVSMRLAIEINVDFSRFANLNPQEDCVVNSTDLSVLLSAYGSNSADDIISDINFDGIVNSSDLSIMLSAYGQQFNATEQ